MIYKINQMLRGVCCVAVLGLLAACAGTTRSTYEQRAEQPTPSTWKVGELWSVVLVARDGRLIQSMTVRFSDQPARTCASGDWYKFEILQAEPPVDTQNIGEPAYHLQGRALTIGLNANFCDADRDIQAELGPSHFAGDLDLSSPWGGRNEGRAYGVKLPTITP